MCIGVYISTYNWLSAEEESDQLLYCCLPVMGSSEAARKAVSLFAALRVPGHNMALASSSEICQGNRSWCSSCRGGKPAVTVVPSLGGT